MLTTAVVTTAVLIAFTVLAQSGSNYRYAAFFLVPLLWVMYALRRKAHLHPWHFLLFASALVLHNLGAFGFYKRKFAGVWFDNIVHFYFGFVGGVILSRFFRRGWKLGQGRAAVAAVFFVMGIGAVHELYEWASTLVLGPEKGMLKLPPYGDPTDTHRDLFSNLLGVLLALLLTAAFPPHRGEARR
jgi:uncharacterized membrane protein YjdF